MKVSRLALIAVLTAVVTGLTPLLADEVGAVVAASSQPAYSVTFTETGLSGQSWSVTWNGSTQTTSSTSIRDNGVAPGVYSYTVTPPANFSASPSSGSFTVATQDVTVPITFSSSAIRYVALGDSYSSGEGAGAGNYFQWYQTLFSCTLPGLGKVVISGQKKPIPGWTCTPYSVGHDIGCHRAPTAWSFPLAQKSTAIIDNVQNAACSGATIDRNLLTKWKDNEQPQVDRLRQLNSQNPVDLVTFTIGGDDVGFGDIARACFLGNGPAYTCRGAEKGVQQKLKKLDLTEPILKLHEAAPGAVIAYVSYPQVVPDSDAAVTKCRWLDPVERVSIRSVVGDINLAEYNAVKSAKKQGVNAVFIDVSDALKGHELCTDNSHVVPIYGNPANSEQAHPDSIDRSATGGTSGQQDLANAVYAQLLAQGVITG